MSTRYMYVSIFQIPLYRYLGNIHISGSSNDISYSRLLQQNNCDMFSVRIPPPYDSIYQNSFHTTVFTTSHIKIYRVHMYHS